MTRYWPSTLGNLKQLKYGFVKLLSIPLSPLPLFLFLSLQLENPIMAQGNVEIWLGSLLTASLNAVKFVIKQASVAIGDPNFALMEYLNNFPAQVIMHSILK